MTGSRSQHDDLRTAALIEAESMLEAGGVEALSVRALAERLAVTSPALYHHFRHKNDLLDALARKGFEAIDRAVTPPAEAQDWPLEERLAGFVRSYIGFALARPEMYDLLFGRALWKLGTPSHALEASALALFRRFVEYVAEEVRRAGLDETTDAVPVAQGTWALVHGLCRQRIDGLYPERETIDALTDEVVRFLKGRLLVGSATRRSAS